LLGEGRKGNFPLFFYHFPTKTNFDEIIYACAERFITDMNCLINKYEFVQILMYLRDEMKDMNDAQKIHEVMTDLMESDQSKIKEKYNLF